MLSLTNEELIDLLCTAYVLDVIMLGDIDTQLHQILRKYKTKTITEVHEILKEKMGDVLNEV